MGAAQGICTGLLPALVLLNFPKAATATLAIVVGIVLDIIFFLALRPRWSTEMETSEPAAYAGA